MTINYEVEYFSRQTKTDKTLRLISKRQQWYAAIKNYHIFWTKVPEPDLGMDHMGYGPGATPAKEMCYLSC